MVSRAELTVLLDELMTEANHLYIREVPGASHLTDEQPLDPTYYLRHRIETIKRIRMTAKTDATALASMVDEDYDAARLWARYACEELDHDRLFYVDLERHGVSRAMIDGTPPFAATLRLGDYLRRRIEAHGAIAAVAYSIFVEWNSERFSWAAVEKARQTFGEDYVEGSSSHLAVDEDQDHYDIMLDIAARLVQAPGAEATLRADILAIAELFRDYFRELYEFASREATQNTREAVAHAAVPVAA